MKIDVLTNYSYQKDKIISRLADFRNLDENNYFKEFLFCLLTPQSNAQKCWQAIEEISKLKELNQKSIFNILKSKTRFHITKTKYVLEAPKSWELIKSSLNNQNRKELRDTLADAVNGYGLKEASHFLRNIGKSNNQIAILDRHILKNLIKYNIIKEAKIKSKKHYLAIESLFLQFADSIKIPPDELDLLWWSQENGEIFK